MIHWRKGIVSAIRSTRPGYTELETELDQPLPGTEITTIKAIAYTDAVGTPEVGDTVLVNVSALAKRLGTGGFGLVVALPDALPADPPPGPGHLVKDRYSPLQTMVLGVDDQESEHHEVLAENESLEFMPVLVADLHSAVPAIIAGIRAADPTLKVAYVLTDGAALPAAFSQAVAGLRESGWLSACISTGQSWGGDFEAVTVQTGLLAAKHVVGADLAIVAQGPGNLGTGTTYGYSGLVVGDHLNAVQLLDGLAIGVLRMSNADARGRHYGISHHTLTSLTKIARPGVTVPVPDFSTLSQAERNQMDTDPSVLDPIMSEQLESLHMHRQLDVDLTGLWSALESSPVRLSTMGRKLPADAAAFLAAAAAGSVAVRLLG